MMRATPATARRAGGSAGLCAAGRPRSRDAEGCRCAGPARQYRRRCHRALNEGGVPGAPEDVRLQRVKIGIAWSPEPLALIERAQVTLRAFLSEQESAGIPPDLLMVNTFFDFPWVLWERPGSADRPVPAARSHRTVREVSPRCARVGALSKPDDGAAGCAGCRRGAVCPKHFSVPAFPCRTRAGAANNSSPLPSSFTKDTDSDVECGCVGILSGEIVFRLVAVRVAGAGRRRDRTSIPAQCA